MTTQQALDTYDAVAGDIFSRRNRKKHKLFPMYNATTLEAAVQEIVGQHTDSDLMIHPETDVKRGKAFVCAVEASNQAAAQRFRAYECGDGDVEWLKDCKIWEAARATTAAPVYFKDITLRRGEFEKRYVDAAIGYNNPTEVLLDEAARVFYRTRKLGAVVSLGTGTRSRSLVSPQEVGHITYAIGAAKTMKDVTVDTEAVHRRVQNIFKDVTSTYFRFNLPDGAAKVKLNGYKQMGMLKEMTASYLKQKHVADEIEALVDVLRLKKTQHLTVGHVCMLTHLLPMRKCWPR
jgi:predicted acylesterase/phospholipase RssA